MAWLEGRHLAVEGGSVFCEVVGTGRPVVLSHDFLLHRESWDAQFTALSDAYRVVRWDRRGYGRSDEASASYSSVDDLAQVIEAAADGPVVLVGCSYGGVVSLHCALDHPELVTALVLVGSPVSGLGYTEHMVSRGSRRTMDVAATDAEIDYWSAVDPWFVAASNTQARERLRELLTANRQNVESKRRWERSPEPAALPRLGEIAVPTLIIVGEHDIPDVHAHAGALEAGIRGARRVVLAGSGHLPQLEVPDAFNDVVRAFLSTLP
ncbi:MAG TPA: alpha/beta hydrolase [Gaiellaceae bacterium]|nr:alpha/beta hydrolase [Gaiellaceae bacterium]